MSVKDYRVDPDLNTAISGINIAEGCPPSGINNAIRQLMADVKEESEAQAQAVEQAKSASSSDAASKVAALDSSLRAHIAATVSGAESSASADAASKVSALESTLRTFIAQELAKYLPLTGGTLNGELSFSGDRNVYPAATNGYLRLWGGNKTSANGANLVLFGSGHAGGWGAGAGGAILYCAGKSYVFASNGTLSTPKGAVCTSADGLLLSSSNVVVFYVGVGKSWTAPSGGTWRYLMCGEYNAQNIYGTVAGGGSVAWPNGGHPAQGIAFRIT